MGRTSIPCSNATRDRLVSLKQPHETWDDCLIRLADSTGDPNETKDEKDEIRAELRQLSEQLDAATEDTLTMNAVREAVRIEVRDQFEEFRQ